MFFIVRCSDSLFVQHSCTGKCFCAGFVRIPAEELVSCAFASWHGNLAAVRHAEVHFLTIRAPVERRVRSCIWMQEHTILDLAPSCIDGQTAFGHGRECVRLRASIIDVPTLKNVASRRSWLIVVTTSFVVGRNVGSICDAANLLELSLTCFGRDSVTIAVVIRSIVEEEFVVKAIEVDVQRISVFDTFPPVVITALAVLFSHRRTLAFVFAIFICNKTIVFVADVEFSATYIHCIGKRISFAVGILLVESNLVSLPCGRSLTVKIQHCGVISGKKRIEECGAGASDGTTIVFRVIPVVAIRPRVVVVFKRRSVQACHGLR